MLSMNLDAYSMDALDSFTMRIISHCEQDCKKSTYACIIGVMSSGAFHVNGAPYQGSIPLWYSASQIERRLAARRMILSEVGNCMVYPFKIYVGPHTSVRSMRHQENLGASTGITTPILLLRSGPCGQITYYPNQSDRVPIDL